MMTKHKKRLIIGMILVLLVAYIIAIRISTAAAEPSQEEPTATPTATYEPLIHTITPRPTYDLTCPSATPYGWGVVTPDARWRYNCLQCIPTPDVYISTPTPAFCRCATATAYAGGAVELGTGDTYCSTCTCDACTDPVTPTVTPTPYQALKVTFDGAEQPADTPRVFSWSGTYASPWNMTLASKSSGAVMYTYSVRLEAVYYLKDNMGLARSVKLSYSNQTADPVEILRDGQVILSVPANSTRTYTLASNVTNYTLNSVFTMRVAKAKGGYQQDGYWKILLESYSTQTRNETYTWYPGEMRQPTPTVGPIMGSYCGSVQQAFDSEDIFSMPSPAASGAVCNQIGGLSVDLSWLPDAWGVPEALTMPGFYLCVRNIKLGVFHILGLEIDVDKMLLIMAFVAVMRLITRS